MYMQDFIYIYPNIAISVCIGGYPNPMLEFMKEGPLVPVFDLTLILP